MDAVRKILHPGVNADGTQEYHEGVGDTTTNKQPVDIPGDGRTGIGMGYGAAEGIDTRTNQFEHDLKRELGQSGPLAETRAGIGQGYEAPPGGIGEGVNTIDSKVEKEFKQEMNTGLEEHRRASTASGMGDATSSGFAGASSSGIGNSTSRRQSGAEANTSRRQSGAGANTSRRVSGAGVETRAGIGQGYEAPPGGIGEGVNTIDTKVEKSFKEQMATGLEEHRRASTASGMGDTASSGFAGASSSGVGNATSSSYNDTTSGGLGEAEPRRPSVATKVKIGDPQSAIRSAETVGFQDQGATGQTTGHSTYMANILDPNTGADAKPQ